VKMKAEESATSSEVSAEEIRNRLHGVVRTTDIHVDLDSRNYIPTSALYLDGTRGLAAARGVPRLSMRAEGSSNQRVTRYMDARFLTTSFALQNTVQSKC
jgi:hypothetical protein